MTPVKFHVYAADLNPRFGTEPGKIRPVVVIQTNLLNETHPSTIVCPITTKVQLAAEILRIHLKKGEAGLMCDSDIIVDQIRSIENRRFLDHLGEISDKNKRLVLTSLRIVILE
ncbi:MAG: type II toxin-antitoxin system PemK/MazF family toxin [Nitrospirae bacterium]|nr:MAG: type II toxin-antitoxin system PemK/MazF family toxin [Nitrospirota bacterium]